MTDQRFKYYTGYEVDNEPSDEDDEIPCTTAITNGDINSDSSDDEFDRPLREYVEKQMFQTTEKKNPSTSTASNAFAAEMENELDTIYNNFITRGTFELPLSTQKSFEGNKTTVKKQNDDNDDDDDDDDSTDDEQQNTKIDQSEQEKVNDDLLYDPDEEEQDEQWMTKQRLKSRGMHTTDNLDKSSLGPTDAVLNCPGCMVLICHDCQRHDTNRNQYRAMFVFNCTIDENRVASVSTANSRKLAKQKKNNKRFKTDESNSTQGQVEHETDEDKLRPVLCNECGTELGVYEPKEELYHFTNVLASH